MQGRDQDRRSPPTLAELISARYSRRDTLKGLLATTALAAALSPQALAASSPAATSRFIFDEITHGVDEHHHVASGYNADILIRWGDPVSPAAAAFDPTHQTPAAQEQQFGYNNDFIAYLPLPAGSTNADHGLLFVNHEYTNSTLMFPERMQPQNPAADTAKPTAMALALAKQLVDIEMSAHGASIVEVKRTDGFWHVLCNSHYGRRISARTTKMRLSGPAAGHPRMRTSADPSGTQVIGMLSNCAGGVTPWGTVLSCEENFNKYFMGSLGPHPEARNHQAYGIPSRYYNTWGKFHDRFNISKEPYEANRFGWVVEVNPYDPTSMPIKRTALGRFKREGAATIVNHDGRLVVYSADDEQFQFLYKYVSHGIVDRQNPAANSHLLDNGTLLVAQFRDDGTMIWHPLVWGTGPLTTQNNFESQADVLIETRRAARLLGATPMDRPEDVEPNPHTHSVYVLLTQNTSRQPTQADPANPRANNAFGHIIELHTANGNHAAQRGRWDILVQCGNPREPEVGALFHPAISPNGWFAAPDNAAVDHQGRLWISTDQGRKWSKTGTADGVWGLETNGPLRGFAKMFFRAPLGAEICGPTFTPDDRTLFVAVQHPAADGARAYPGFERDSTYADPATRWPDFQDDMPPRPSVVAITKQGGGVIGT